MGALHMPTVSNIQLRTLAPIAFSQATRRTPVSCQNLGQPSRKKSCVLVGREAAVTTYKELSLVQGRGTNRALCEAVEGWARWGRCHLPYYPTVGLGNKYTSRSARLRGGCPRAAHNLCRCQGSMPPWPGRGGGEKRTRKEGRLTARTGPGGSRIHQA